MENAVFHSIEGTRDWEYKQFKLMERKHQWILMTGTTSILFESIYDVLSNLTEKGFHVTFRTPPSMDYIPSSCSS